MNALWITLGAFLIILIIVLIIAILYGVFLLRKANIIAKKIDYLIEDATYKMEALTPTVDMINKFSNRALAIETVTEKQAKTWFKYLRNNQSSIFELMQTLLKTVSKNWDDNFKKTRKAYDFNETEIIIEDDDIKAKDVDKSTKPDDSLKQNSNTKTSTTSEKKNKILSEKKLKEKLGNYKTKNIKDIKKPKKENENVNN